MIRRVVAVGAVLAMTASIASADLRRARGAAWLHEEVTYLRRWRGDPARAGSGDAMAGISAFGIIGSRRSLGLLVGVDLAAGSTVPAGFAYRAILYPLGAGVPLGRWGTLGLGFGVGASGAVGTLDDGVVFPASLSFEAALGSRLRLTARGRATWLAGAPRRDSGAPSLAAVDELDAMIGLRFGRRYSRFGFMSGNGYVLGVAYSEREGARLIGATIGYAIDLNNQ